MTAAIFGLAGVVAGGLITFLTQAWMLSRQERARMNAAARVIHGELLALTAMLGLQQTDSIARFDTTRLLAAWPEYRDDLTRLPVVAWYSLTELIATLSLGTQLDEQSPGSRVSGQLAAAMKALEPLVCDDDATLAPLRAKQRECEDSQAMPKNDAGAEDGEFRRADSDQRPKT